MKKLRTGTNIIRILLSLGIFLSLAGLILSLVPAVPNRLILSILFSINMLALVAVIRILISRKLVVRIKHIAQADRKSVV